MFLFWKSTDTYQKSVAFMLQPPGQKRPRQLGRTSRLWPFIHAVLFLTFRRAFSPHASLLCNILEHAPLYITHIWRTGVYISSLPFILYFCCQTLPLAMVLNQGGKRPKTADFPTFGACLFSILSFPGPAHCFPHELLCQFYIKI